MRRHRLRLLHLRQLDDRGSRVHRRPHHTTALAAALAAAALVLGPTAAALADEPGDDIEIGVTIPGDTDGPFTVSNAEFRWGLNPETGSGAFFGGCNFLSAGTSGDAGGAIVWPDDTYFATTDGAVTIERPTGDSGYEPLAWADRCLDPQGNTVTTADFRNTGVQAVISGGKGDIDPDAGTAEISWDGAFTVVFYGGMTYWWAADPVLTVEDGKGRITATGGGFGASMEDLSKWEELPEREIVLADLGDVDLSSGVGFSTIPDYLGVEITTPPDGAPQRTDREEWGSFPQSFVDFQVETGQAAYWYSSGGLRDPAKPTSRLYVSYDADAPIEVTDPGGPPDLPPLTPPGLAPPGLTPPGLNPPGLGGAGWGDTGTGIWGANSGGVLPASNWIDWPVSTPLGGGILPGALPGGSNQILPNVTAGLPGADAFAPQEVDPTVVPGDEVAATLAAATALDVMYADRSGLIPLLQESFADPRQRVAWALSAVFALSGATFIGFRKGWLVLPWSRT